MQRSDKYRVVQWSIAAPSPSASNEVDDVSRLFGRLWRRRGWFAMAFVAIMLPLIAVIGLWPSSFYASGTVIIGNLEPADSSLAAAIQKLGDPADLASQLLVAKSPRMIRLALERPGVFQAITEECNYGAGITYMPFSPDCAKLKPGSRELLEYVSSRYSVKGRRSFPHNLDRLLIATARGIFRIGKCPFDHLFGRPAG